MALNARQKAAYQHTCNIWQVTRTVNATTGTPGDETYTLYASGVKCLYQYTKNYDDYIQGIGRVKRQTSETQDTVHFDAAQTLEDGWILKNVTLLPDGTRSPAYGEFHRILGAPLNIPNAGSRRANKKSVLAMTMEHVPVGLS